MGPPEDPFRVGTNYVRGTSNRLIAERLSQSLPKQERLLIRDVDRLVGSPTCRGELNAQAPVAVAADHAQVASTSSDRPDRDPLIRLDREVLVKVE